ncbi:MAG: NAD(P)-binding domain-containing protein [Propionibacteriaceae bacterium]|jgi:pyrroline-5-carboxylate reductase|nr:NAD(P)-binding domain-containing protein [Propionibacteriaceae bacterium]
MKRIGIIGVGIIGAAVARGLLAGHGDAVELLLSPRGRERAQELADEFSNVRVLESNQAVLDACDQVILAVLRPVAEEVIDALRFRPDQLVISLVGGMKVNEVRTLAGVEDVVRLVPLPFIAQLVGPLAVYPANVEVEAVFGALGEYLPVADERDFDSIVVISALMSPYYLVLTEVIRWGIDQGLRPELAARYTTSLFAALLSRGRGESTEELLELWREMTPGGLNELAVDSLRADGAVSAWSTAMSKVLDRIRPRD